MKIGEAEEALFAEWRSSWPESRQEQFVRDGIVDEEAYLASSPRVLFVLKEVNDPGGGGWDLREFLRNRGSDYRFTWLNISRWVEGIRRLPQDIPWQELEEIDPERRQRALHSIAAVNLKKFPGGGSTDWTALWTAVNADGAFLKRQLTLYGADIVICCGTGDYVGKLFDLHGECTPRGIWCAEFGQGVLVSYLRPEARTWDCLKHYGLMDALRARYSGPAASPAHPNTGSGN